MTLTTAQLDRAVGVLLGTAAGDALGAAYEFGPPRGPELEVAMVGGGSFGWEPGEWTDDTSMAIAIAEVAATGADLRDEEALDAIVHRWHEWMKTAKDVGIQTSSVLRAAGWLGLSAQTAREASAALHERTGRTAGNGSLMRTAPLALAYLDDEAALVEAARAVSELTHYDPEAGDACVLWCLAIRHAILTGVLDVRIGLQHIDADRRETCGLRGSMSPKRHSLRTSRTTGGWSRRCRVRGRRSRPRPSRKTIRPRVSSAPITCAWRSTPRCEAAATPTPSRPSRADCSALSTGPQRSPRSGVVCCTAGPGLATRDLVALATRIVKADKPFSYDIDPMTPVRHPHDDGVWLGDVATLRALPPGVDAVVSLCRVHDDDLPVGVEQIDVRLIDDVGPDANPNLDFVLTDTVRLIEQLRNEGRTVLVHCVAAQSRTPTVAALYGARRQGARHQGDDPGLGVPA